MGADDTTAQPITIFHHYHSSPVFITIWRIKARWAVWSICASSAPKAFALDLVGRKLPKDGGRALQAFFAEVQGFCAEHGKDDAMKVYVEPLGKALGHLQAATMWFMQNALAKPDNAGADSTDYMNLFGLVALGYMWARMAQAARESAAQLGSGEPAITTDANAAAVAVDRFGADCMSDLGD